MGDNEYIPKEKDKVKSENDFPKGKTIDTDKKKPRTKEKKEFPINTKKIRTISGAILVLVALFLVISYVSYFFTWKIDQDAILTTSFFDYIFNSSIPAPENWLGKFGAWMSHLLIFNSFGIASIGICLILFLLGIKILLSVELLPFKRTSSITASFMVWGSLCLGYFSNYVN
jgi:S-DNA-T family DNA segregation ATPase FtsK/SpoIIIE